MQRTLRPPISADFDLSEKAFDAQFRDLIGALGFTASYHTFNSKRSQSGYPDWTIVRERPVWVELKTMRGRLSAAQAFWVRSLLRAGCEVYVIRPRQLADLATVLAYRGDPFQARGPVVDVAARLREATRVEAEAL